jgi:hypothetical protein
MMQDTRREILKKVTVGGLGLTVVGGSGIASAEPLEDCDNFESKCDGTYVKYELVELEDGTCEFQEETSTGIYEDSLTITESKDDDNCEPLAVSWDNSEYETLTLAAKGSVDCDIDEDPNGSYSSDLENRGGQRAAISNLQFCVTEAERLPCPDGTRPVARYNVVGDDIEFDSGEDVVEFSNKTTDADGLLTGFDFESIDGSDDNSEPETLTTVTVETSGGVQTFEVDEDFENDKQSGSVSVSEPISRVLFCEAVYAQADFVTGDVIEDLCDDEYSKDKISSVTWSSYNGQLDGVQGQFNGEWVFNGDGTITVNYEDDYDQKVSLAVYEVDDPNFQDNTNISFSETRCRQTLFDSDTDEVGDQDGTLTADLPSLE